tara:strand:+ start:493 stop:948 length:456 start_codon:yes stop_codon:yes gene_type:complete
MDKNLKTVLTGATILVGVIGLYFVGKALVKKVKAKNVKKRKKKVKDELGLGEVSAAEQVENEAAKNYNPTADRKSLYGYIGGANFATYEEEVNELITGLTDAQLKKLAVSWKKVRKKSLYKSLDEEWDACGWSLYNCYKTSMTRLSGLGLR